MARSTPSGRTAESPSQFGWPAWRDVTKRAGKEFSKDNLSIVSAGVAFYLFLALFPAIAAFVSIYGLVADPRDVERVVSSMQGILPQEATTIITDQMTKIAATSSSALGFGAVLSVLLALWSAMNGTKAVIQALNIAYEEEERRGFFRLSGIAFLLTIGAMLAFVGAVILVVGVPVLVDSLPMPEIVRTVVDWSRWPLLAIGMMLALAVLYRYAPSRAAPRWQWVSIGAVTATLLWLIGSALFSWYVSNSGSYNATYGSLAAIVILLMWAYISALVVLLGAELNSEMEHQTARDTTTGREEPIGRREAAMADTVAGEEVGKGVGAYAQGGDAGERRSHRKGREGMGGIEREIARTRRDLMNTLGELHERLTPGRLVETAAARVREAGTRKAESGRGTFDYLMRERPLLLGAIGFATGAIVAASQHRKRINVNSRASEEGRS